jgi:hypothetical protein
VCPSLSAVKTYCSDKLDLLQVNPEHGSSSQCPSVTPVKPVYTVMINYVIESHGLVITDLFALCDW